MSYFSHIGGVRPFPQLEICDKNNSCHRFLSETSVLLLNTKKKYLLLQGDYQLMRLWMKSFSFSIQVEALQPPQRQLMFHKIF